MADRYCWICMEDQCPRHDSEGEIVKLNKKLEIAEKALNNIASFGYAGDLIIDYALDTLAKMSKLDGE